MAYIANNTWTDAANYGQGLGQSLSAALLQLPQQRAEMAMRLAQLQQMGQLRQAQQQFNQLRQSDLQQYRDDKNQLAQQLVDQKNQANTEHNQHLQQVLEQKGGENEMANAIAQMKLHEMQRENDYRTGKPYVADGYVFTPPSVPQQGLSQPGSGPPGGQNPQQSGWSSQALPPRPMPSNAANGAAMGLEGKLSLDYLGGLSSTNPAVQAFVQTNVLPRLLDLQRRGQVIPQQAQTNGLVAPQPPPQVAPTKTYNWDPNNGLQQVGQ